MGVKSLWSLLAPVGRPVMLETAEGKIMAIDSSIWIYQFQATMRDKEGRALVNAHVLGFLRRISKLLFYGIKPVFVFDGGAPALKRSTITERKNKKAGAAAAHAKIAEKLLAAQMRREALNRVDPNTTESPRANSKKTSSALDDSTVYLEDIDPKSIQAPRTSPYKNPSPNKPKDKYHDHDQYRLPDIDLNAAIANASSGNAPDPRLATEEELRAFIEDMRPEDFDYNSPAFRDLPTEVQYEIIGDLRLKSRQTSYKRLETMLKQTKTPLDFSKQQILHLKQRNELTQQLLTTTDNMGKSQLSIPVRVASERNKEYVLIKNEGKDGGWILGIRDEGTMDKPIELDQSEHEIDSDDDDDMEEVIIPGSYSADPDLQSYQRDMALSSIAGRQALPYKPSSSAGGKMRSMPSFDNGEFVGDNEDGELATAVQASLDDMPQPTNINIQPVAGPSNTRDDEDEADYVVGPTRLQTQLLFANASPKKTGDIKTPPSKSTFGRPFLLTAKQPSLKSPDRILPTNTLAVDNISDKSDDALPVTWQTTKNHPEVELDVASLESESSEDDMEEILPQASLPITVASTAANGEKAHIPKAPSPYSFAPSPSKGAIVDDVIDQTAKTLSSSGSVKDADVNHVQSAETSTPFPPFPTPITIRPDLTAEAEQSHSDDDELVPWSRSPTPVLSLTSPSKADTAPVEELDWDATQEMDPHAEEGEFARFLSQMKGRNIETVRNEIDEEIKSLNKQRKNAMRDSEDITQQMISQIMMMLRLFGIPYMTAPMEAEAQCAELVTMGLVDGVITDDSDVFLFGGSRVYKNMFNQSKTVECFLTSDLTRELGLDRDTLIRLAYLLGSDYVDGLPGVGPVIAMELLKEFPGEEGLHKFKDWWSRVQTGKDSSAESSSKFRKRFKKKFKEMYLQPEWPNPAVRDAYYHPTVDSSDEPFKWGLPDLDALRSFLRDELGWNQAKVDELLLPIIQKMNQRNQAAALNRQGNLNAFLDITGGNVTQAPRKRKAYTSKRLQQVVSEYRKEQNKATGQGSTSPSPAPEDSEASEEPPAKKQKKAAARSGRRGRGRGGKSGSSRKKRQTTPSDDEENEVEIGEGTQPREEPIERAQMGLQPRPRRIQKARPVDNDENDIDSA